MKIIKSIVYVINFSINNFWGGGIVQKGGEILPKVSAKFWELKISPKLQHYIYASRRMSAFC